MEDLIMKIIDIEAKAQQIIKDAKEADENLDADIAKESESLRLDIENKAAAKAETIRQTETNEAEKEIEKIREKTRSDISELERKLGSMKENWVDAIVKNIVG